MTNHLGNSNFQATHSDYLDYVDMDSYLQDACLKELVTADLFIRLDKHTTRRRLWAEKMDIAAIRYKPRYNKPTDPHQYSFQTAESQNSIRVSHRENNSNNITGANVWLVAPELSDSLEPALNIAKQFLRNDYAVHLVTRLKPNDVEHALNKYGLVINNTDSRNENGIRYHFVKPLESYYSHIKKKGNIILSFYLPLSASLSIHGIKHILVVDASQNESMLLLGRAEGNLKQKVEDFLPRSAMVDLASIPDQVATWNSDAASQLEPVLSRKVFDLKAIVPQSTQDLEISGNLPPPHVPTLSACLIAKDEEGMIEDCLLSLVPVIDEVVLNDTGSSDNTAEIAKDYGARVIRTQWCNDFSKSRNESIDLAEGDYVLVIDADERINENSKIIFKKELLKQADAYLITIINHSDTTFPVVADAIRLFKNISSHRFEGKIHEQIAPTISTPIIETELQIDHHGYTKVVAYAKNKRTRNISLLAEQFASNKDMYDLFQIGVEMKLTRNFDEASKILTDVYNNTDKQRPFVGLAALHAFESYLNLQRLDTAIEFGKQVLRDIPDFHFLSCLLVDALIATGKYSEAIEVLMSGKDISLSNKLLPRTPGDTTYVYHWLMARAKLGLGDRQKSLNEIKTALSYNVSWAPAQMFLAGNWPDLTVNILTPLNPSTVKPAVKQLLAIENTGNAETLATNLQDQGALGKVYLWLNDYDKAAICFAESKDPCDRDRASALILSGLAKTDSEKAQKLMANKQSASYYAFQGIPAPNGRLPQVISLLSFLLDIRDLPRFHKGTSALSNAEDPDLLVGKLLYEKGYLDLALDPLVRSCSHTKTPDVLAMLGDIACLKNHFEEAIVFYDELSKFRHLTVSEYMVYINALLKNHNSQQALTVLEECMRIYPHMADSKEVNSIKIKLNSVVGQ